MDGRGHPLRWVGVIAVGLLLAAVAAIVALGSGDSETQPFFYSVHETRRPCSPGVFLPQREAQHLLDHPPPKDWRAVQDYPRAVFANTELVALKLRPGTEEKVTLHAIRYHVERRKRMRGTTLYPYSCFLNLETWLVVANFDDQRPHPVIYDHREGEENLTSLPWTISLDEPLTVLFQPNSVHCYCIWTADVPWTSGSRHGTIHISEGKKPFEITFSGGMPAHFAEKDGWS